MDGTLTDVGWTSVAQGSALSFASPVAQYSNATLVSVLLLIFPPEKYRLTVRLLGRLSRTEMLGPCREGCMRLGVVSQGHTLRIAVLLLAMEWPPLGDNFEVHRGTAEKYCASLIFESSLR